MLKVLNEDIGLRKHLSVLLSLWLYSNLMQHAERRKVKKHFARFIKPQLSTNFLSAHH